MNTTNRMTEPSLLSPTTRAALPAQELVLDRLADLLFEVDELMGLLAGQDAMNMHWIQPHIQSAYDNVNALMKRLCD